MKTTTRHGAVVHSTRMVVAVALLLSCFTSLARAETCTNQNLYGTYVLTLSGFRTFLTPPQAIAFSPIAVGSSFGGYNRYFRVASERVRARLVLWICESAEGRQAATVKIPV
jgi:hypothetical protein